MKRSWLSVVIGLVAAGLLLVGCTQAAPAPEPTKAPAAPAKAAEPAKAPAQAAEPTKAPAAPAAPTKAPEPAKKVDFPQKGKPITFLVPWAAGGGTDVGGRLLAAEAEKVLGTNILIVNKAGAGSQVGLTEFVQAKPDGYTLGLTNLPGTITIYQDPRRQAIFSRKDFQPLALHVEDVIAMTVKTDSQFKSVKEVIDYAKANPFKLKTGTSGILSTAHVAILMLEKATGAQFTIVHLDGGPSQATALLGGNIDVAIEVAGVFLAHTKNQTARMLGIAASEPSPLFPGIPTWESQGYKVYMAASRGLCLPGGTPKEIADILADAFKKAMATPEHQQKMKETGLLLRYMGPEQFTKFWDDQDRELKPFVDEAAKEK